jgi:hypothetical protein
MKAEVDKNARNISGSELYCGPLAGTLEGDQ